MTFKEHLKIACEKQDKKTEVEKREHVPTEDLLKRMDEVSKIQRLSLNIKHK
ncbi:hypothetical protein [Virgibacillus halodenitrificans]|uniref:hypothetical protein n=1 Tax=Virgibacillus halodenitrificans TaxID=1482 RepID=UPI0013CF3220|nr:hypothetical protein [Virgibacillus halodenitrificans]